MPSLFAKPDFAHVIARFLEPPMPAPHSFQRARSRLAWRQADHPLSHFTTAFAAPQHNPLRFSSYDLLHRGPVHILTMRVATGQSTAFQATRPFLAARSNRIPDRLIGCLCRQAEKHIQILVHGRLVFLDNHQRVTVLEADLSGSRAHAVQRIQPHELATQIRPSQQSWDGATLLTLERDRYLTQHSRVGMLHQRDELARMPLARTSTDGLAIDRTTLQRIRWSGGSLHRSACGWLERCQGLLQDGDIQPRARTAQGRIAWQVSDSGRQHGKQFLALGMNPARNRRWRA